MYRLLILISLSFFCTGIVHGAQDTAFFDAFWRPLPGRDGAAFFRPWPKMEDGKYKLTDYYISGKVQSTGYYKKKDIKKLKDFDMLWQNRDGRLEEYYDSTGILKSEGTYSNGHLNGLAKTYYDDGKLWVESMYANDSLDGGLNSYYKDGSLKRHATYTNGKLVEGQMYDKNGSLIPFTPLEVMPQAPYNVDAYLVKSVRYPGKAQSTNIEGMVVVQFIIDKKGHVANAVVVKSVHPLLDAEALRVVSEMSDWQPGKMDDEPVDVYYKLPVTFRLEE